MHWTVHMIDGAGHNAGSGDQEPSFPGLTLPLDYWGRCNKGEGSGQLPRTPLLCIHSFLNGSLTYFSQCKIGANSRLTRLKPQYFSAF